MVILGKNGVSHALKIFLDLVFFGGILIYISLPFSLRLYFDAIFQITSSTGFIKNVSKDTIVFANLINQESYLFLLGTFIITGFFALVIVYELRKILKNLNLVNPFVYENVKSLRAIAVSSIIISICYMVKILFYNSFLTIVLAMVFIIAGLFSLVLSEVFRQAVAVKEENDLTI